MNNKPVLTYDGEAISISPPWKYLFIRSYFEALKLAKPVRPSALIPLLWI
jgi:hypothetical protein